MYKNVGRNILCDISNVHLTSLGLVEEECFSNVCCSVGQALSWWNMRTRLPWCLLTASQCRRPDLSVIGKVWKRNCELVFKFTFGENTLRFLLHPGQYLQNECVSQRVRRLINEWIEVPASKCIFLDRSIRS